MNPNIFQPAIKPARTEHFRSSGWKWYLIRVLILMINLNVKLTEAKTSDLKYILQWTSNEWAPLNTWGSGQRALIERRCPVSNCFVTNRRDYFWGDLTKFDAIVFNGRNLMNLKLSDLPKKRSPHQKYIFVQMESSDNYPICDPIFDGFFNWTATYKLNSDIVYSFILIRDSSGEEVAPRVNMTWISPMSETNESLVHILEKKTEVVAWFVSNCDTRSEREKYAESLKKALKKYYLTLDIYGNCGNLQCPRSKQKKCDKMLRDKYFFYLSFMNSFAEDYITEKVLHAFGNIAVPIVYGGLNYSRFLPPGSYIDARVHTPEQLAALMVGLIAAPRASYKDFFRWRNHYSYESPYAFNVCRLCAALHNQTLFNAHSVYEDFRGWWNPDHKRRCRET